MQDIQVVAGKRIRQIRQRKGITQDNLAEMAGLNRVHLYRLETGKQTMTLRTLKMVAEALNVKATEIIEGF